jgi:glutamine synthetase
MAPMFEMANLAADHNQLVMETMQRVALRHDLVCLLFEKPFAGVNGSGKHNNWSLATDDGLNLLDPGHTPHENETFLVFLAALMKAVDRHATKLRAAASNPGNDLRLGANEAPPAIVSIFMGTELTNILESIAAGREASSSGKSFLKIGVDTLPALPKDNTDRNRTSPFAFTGNKFEFRMVASSASISGANVVLNTIAAEALDEIATRLEKAKDVTQEAQAIIREIAQKHSRIVFNGNNYSEEWVVEAKKRGLPNVKSWIESLKEMNTKEAHKLFEKYHVLSERELESRYEIYVEQYAKNINIEARTAIARARRLYLPEIIGYAGDLAKTIADLKAVNSSAAVPEALLGRISGLLASANQNLEKLEAETAAAAKVESIEKRAVAYRDQVVVTQAALRADIDQLETLLPSGAWPVPSYAEILFGF